MHLDGYNQLAYLTGQQGHFARNDFFYFDDDGQLVATRWDVLQLGRALEALGK